MNLIPRVDEPVPDEWDELESRILATADYVRPSQDLRPRLMEAVEGGKEFEQVLGSTLWTALAAVFILGWCTRCASLPSSFVSFSQKISDGTPLSPTELIEFDNRLGGNRPSSDRHAMISGDVDLAWRMVASFKAARSQAAVILQFSQIQ